MKRHGLLNAPLSALIAELGHTDTLILADAGLPIPRGITRIDLAVTPGLPGFLPVLEALLDELCLDGVTLARETIEQRPSLTADIKQRLARLETRDNRDIAIAQRNHEDFKALLPNARAVIRTGECTPFANLALHSGVPF